MMRTHEASRLNPELNLGDDDEDIVADTEILAVDTIQAYGDDLDQYEDDIEPIAEELSWMGFRSPVEYI